VPHYGATALLLKEMVVDESGKGSASHDVLQVPGPVTNCYLRCQPLPKTKINSFPCNCLARLDQPARYAVDRPLAAAAHRFNMQVDRPCKIEHTFCRCIDSCFKLDRRHM